MVKPFRLARIPQVIFGSGALADLPSMAAAFGRNILLVTGAHSFSSSPRSEVLIEKLHAYGLSVNHVKIPGEPSPIIIDDAAAMFRKSGIDLVAGIGGGSVIDAGKAVSAMLKADGSVTDYLEVVGSREHPGTKVPFIAVPTTSGTGSEATKNAVISQVGKDGFKRSLRHDNFVPDVAVVDPELTLGCPPEITAAAGMDCFTQLAEAYLSTKASDFTDALALQGLMAIKRSLVRSFDHGDDIGARADMSFAALMSGICLANAGLGAVHGLAGTVGALYPVPHGVVCGTLMARANEINVKTLRKRSDGHTALHKYAILGRIFADSESKSDSYYTDFLIDYLHAVTYRLKLPLLGRFGLGKDDIPGIVSRSEVKNNPVKLSDEELAEIILGRL